MEDLAKNKQGNLIEELFEKQKKIFRTACYGITILLILFAGVLFFQLETNYFLPSIILVYAFLTLINIVAYEAHNQALSAWLIMMLLMYAFVIHTIYLTGGIQSGMSTFLVAMSFVSYVHSRSRGRLGFILSILVFLGFVILERNGIKFPNMVSENSIDTFNLYSLMLSCIILGLFFGEMMARTTYQAFKSKQEIMIQNKIIQEKNREIEILSTLAKYSNMAMVVVDLTGKVIWMNDIVQKKLDKKIEENPAYFNGKGLDFVSVYDISDNLDLRRHIGRVLEKKRPLAYETLERDSGNNEEWTLSTITPLFDKDGNIVQMSIVDAQITDQKHTEADIRIKSQELQQRNEEILTQRDEIEEQKKYAERHRDEIISSINYAKKIQTAMLRYENRVTSAVPQHFIIFEPKDIVSGDFYWMAQKNNLFYMAVGDCTGHGVPGAMLAMMGSSYLNEICAINRPLAPSFILDELRDRFINDLEQDGSNYSRMDGMDISLIRLDVNTLDLQWSGAQNPLIMVQNGELVHIKGNVQPIGYSDNPTLFTNHEFKLHPGDGIYLFSDGFPDQFGGLEGRKFGHARFRNLLRSTYALSPEEQKNYLITELCAWRNQGREDRTDDVCVLGIRI